jgi:hypothetical protein
MSLCNLPKLTIPQPSIDVLAIAVALLQGLGVSIPKLPTIAFPTLFCPID